MRCIVQTSFSLDILSCGISFHHHAYESLPLSYLTGSFDTVELLFLFYRAKKTVMHVQELFFKVFSKRGSLFFRWELIPLNWEQSKKSCVPEKTSAYFLLLRVVQSDSTCSIKKLLSLHSLHINTTRNSAETLLDGTEKFHSFFLLTR